jgi:7,8-didemethyl-8-hydroxy-5-deazariboflavin synthase CofG subunit
MNATEISKLKDLSLSKLKKLIKADQEAIPDRDERKRITYSKNFTISLSNYCHNFCGYCFYNHRVPKEKNDENIALVTQKKVKELMSKAIESGCKEVLLISGENPEQFEEVRIALMMKGYENFIDYAIDICKKMLENRLLPHTNIGVITIDYLKKLKKFNASMGLMLESSNQDLCKKGGVHEFSPGKAPEKRKAFIENAGRLRIPFTTGLLLGIGEHPEDRIRDLLWIKEVHDSYHHIQEVIIQNFMVKNGIAYKPRNSIIIEEMLKTVAIAKLIFKETIAIQVPPNFIRGHEIEFIELGVNDFGGISPITEDYINPEKPWPQIEYLRDICEMHGYELKERLPLYDKYANAKDFVSKNIKDVIDDYI